MDYDVGIVKQRRIISPSNSYFSVSAGYQGPGDVVSGALNFYGLRAYSAAIGSALTIAVRIVDQSNGNAEQDLNVKADGTLDLSPLAGITGHTFSVKTFYNQLNTAVDSFTNASVGNQPRFILSGSNGLPVVRFNSGINRYLASGTVNGGTNVSKPFTASIVAKRTANFTTAQSPWGTTNAQFFFNTSANSVGFYDGTSSVTATASDSTMHSLILRAVSSAGTMYVNGSSASSTGTLGAGAFVATSVGMGVLGDTVPTNIMDGDVQEFIIWSGDKGATAAANLYSNQQSYWGVPI